MVSSFLFFWVQSEMNLFIANEKLKNPKMECQMHLNDYEEIIIVVYVFLSFNFRNSLLKLQLIYWTIFSCRTCESPLLVPKKTPHLTILMVSKSFHFFVKVKEFWRSVHWISRILFWMGLSNYLQKSFIGLISTI